MGEREEVIKSYFNAWVNKESSNLEHYFHPDIYYCECYGPEYNGINQIMQWFLAWNKVGSVLTWKIKQILHQEDTYTVEWYFECDYENNIDGFDGVSIIEFRENRIVSLKEFQSKAEHIQPYQDEGVCR